MVLLRAGFVCRSLPFNAHQGILVARRPRGLSRLVPARWAEA
jgi:hypothetical protein